MRSWRLLLITGDVRYADLIERVPGFSLPLKA